MKHSTRLQLGLGAVGIATALVLSGCASGGGSSIRRRSTARQADARSRCSCSGSRRRSSPATTPPSRRASTRRRVSTSRSRRPEPTTVPIDVLAAGDADYAISWVPKVLGSIEQGTNVTDVAQIFERVRHDADLVQGQGHHLGRRPQGQEGRQLGLRQPVGAVRRHAEGRASTPRASIKLVQQAFDMNGFLAGDIDAAQAMTYNEYAQVLETVNPDDRQALPAERPQRHQLERRRHGDAPGRDLGERRQARQRQGLRRATPRSSSRRRSRAGSTRGTTPRRPRHHRDRRPGSTLGTSHQLWMTNEVNKLIWPSTDGIGIIQKKAWDQTVKIAQGDQGRHRIDHHHHRARRRRRTATSTSTKALKELKAEGVDVMGTSFTPLTVTLNEGGK